MEHNSGNQNMPPATLCRTGCGFYGNSQFEGMCSKCFKDAFKRRQQNSSPTQMNGRNSPLTITSSVSATPTSISPAAAAALTNAVASVTTTPSLSPASTPVDTSKAPNIDTATPTVPSSSTTSHDKENASNDEKDTAEVACAGATASTASETDENSGDKEKKPKKNRCHTCKKKVGLTGFECRCGGMYCSMHRYSDKHGCTFNYKELAQAQIRKNNPVVVGKKIQKI